MVHHMVYNGGSYSSVTTALTSEQLHAFLLLSPYLSFSFSLVLVQLVLSLVQAFFSYFFASLCCFEQNQSKYLFIVYVQIKGLQHLAMSLIEIGISYFLL